jgi:hypothetical protein
MKRRAAARLAAAFPLLLAAFAASALAQEAPAPTPSPKPARKPQVGKAPHTPLDFTGTWELDAKASHGVVPAMENAALKVHQNGNRIWIEPLGTALGKLQSEEIVVDGQLYEKKMGRDKGTVLAKWGTDGTSLWIEAVKATEEDPRAAVQRMVWRLRDFGNTWTRQSWSISGETTKQTFLVFRKRPADWVPTPILFPTTPTPTPAPPQ